MKIAMIAVSAAAMIMAAAAAAPAAASDYDIYIGGVAVDQNVVNPVEQGSLSVLAAIGDVRNSVMTSTALSAVNMASIDTNIVQGAAGTVNGALVIDDVRQTLQGATDQTSVSLAGSGDLTGSTLTGLAANLANNASISVSVRQ